MRKIKVIVLWLSWHVFLGWLCWESVNGNIGAGNLLRFIAWALFVLVSSAVIVLHDDWDKMANDRTKPVIPPWLSFLSWSLMAFFLAWHGWIFTAIAFLMLSLIDVGLRTQPIEQKV